MSLRFPLTALLVALLTGNARAHHEAIFGPQSSLLQSQKSFVSLQVFSKRVGSGGTEIQDTTALASLGISPFETLPLSFAATLPAAFETKTGAHGHGGIEDILLGARYRFDLPALQRAFGAADNFLMAMGGVELPTGTVHRAAFDRPPSYLGALFAMFERGSFSAVAFTFGSLRAADGRGTRDGHELFAGAGLAYTPIDAADHVLSFQLGTSYEHLFAERALGQAVANSGGGQLMISPTVVLGLSGRWQLFALTAAPVHQGRRAPEHRDRWRVGAGVIYSFGAGHEHARERGAEHEHEHEHE